MKTTTQQADEILQKCSTDCGSHHRLGLALKLLKKEPSPQVFWEVLCRVWDTCDNTWAYRADMRFLMLLHQNTRRQFVPSDQQVPRHLPSLIPIWRGCSRRRVKGFSWSLNRSVAEGFARGHREIRVPNAVIASANIPKRAVYFVANERKEEELVINPAKLRDVTVERFLVADMEPSTVTFTAGS
jgi:hypothetical protein